MKIRALAASVLTAALLLPCAAAAQTGPVYPPPGGVTFGGTGNPIGAGGRTNTYSGLDNSAFDEMWWTAVAVSNAWHTTQGGPTGNMNYTGFDAVRGVHVWTPTAPTAWTHWFGPQVTVNASFVLQFQPNDGVAGYMSSGWLPFTTAGAEGIGALAATQPLLDVTNTSTFSVWYRYEVNPSLSLAEYYDGNNNGVGQINSGMSGGFYFTEQSAVATPEPITMTLLGTGLAGVAAARRRRKQV